MLCCTSFSLATITVVFIGIILKAAKDTAGTATKRIQCVQYYDSVSDA